MPGPRRARTGRVSRAFALLALLVILSLLCGLVVEAIRLTGPPR
jgi:hypothetical protein